MMSVGNKSKLLLIIAVLLVITVLTGCSKDEIQYMLLVKEMSLINNMEVEGELSIDISGEFIDRLLEEEPELEELLQYTEGLTLKYKIKQSNDDNIAYVDLKFKYGELEEYNQLTEMILDNNEGCIYIKISDITKLMENSEYFTSQEEFKEYKEEFGEFEFIKYKYIDGVVESLTTEEQRDMIDKVKKIIEEIYKGYESGLVKKDRNGYIFEITVEKLIDTLIDFLKYTVNNIDEIEKNAYKLIDDTPDDVYDKFAKSISYYMSKDELKESIKEIASETRADKDEILEGISGIKEDMKYIIGLIPNIKVTHKLGKVKDKEYIQSNSVTVEHESISVNVNNESKIFEVESVDITIPVDKVKDIEDYMSSEIEIMQEVYEDIPGEKTMVIQKDLKEYIIYYNNYDNIDVDFGEIDLIIIDGRSYLPLRFVGEKFGETVGWEYQSKTAYIQRGDVRITMEGFIKDDKTFIKVRDFEKLGYNIDWIEVSGEIIINKK